MYWFFVFLKLFVSVFFTVCEIQTHYPPLLLFPSHLLVMQSLDSSAEWLSHESLSSTPSFPYSESDHTEDEGDIFSEGEGEGGRASLECFSLAAASPPSHLRPIGYHREQRGPLAEEQQGGAGRRGQPPSPATAPPTEGDVAFARKVSVEFCWWFSV